MRESDLRTGCNIGGINIREKNVGDFPYFFFAATKIIFRHFSIFLRRRTGKGQSRNNNYRRHTLQNGTCSNRPLKKSTGLIGANQRFFLSFPSFQTQNPKTHCAVPSNTVRQKKRFSSPPETRADLR